MNPSRIKNLPALLLLAMTALALPAAAQAGSSDYATPYAITNLAGQPGVDGTNDGIGNLAQFDSPGGLAIDYSNNLYVADMYNDTIRKAALVGTNWVVTTLAGQAGMDGSSDGTNGAARFYSPGGVAVDYAGNIYVADIDNSTIRKITPVGTNWVVTTIAGTAGQFGSDDGTNGDARFLYPFGVAVDFATNVYVADLYNSTIRKITPVGTNWVVTTIAGQAGNPGSADGTNTDALFFEPASLAVDGAGNVFVADTYNDTIRKLTPMGTNWVVTTLAGMADNFGFADGTNTAAQFYYPFGVAVDSADNLYVADTYNSLIRKMTPVGTNWVVTTLAGLAGVTNTNNGTGSSALFNSPRGVAVNSARDIYIADTDNDTIRQGFPPVLTNYDALLPVYRITEAGATGAQATNLAGYLNVASNELTLSNGLVSFIDSSNYLAVPVTNMTDVALSNSLVAQTSNQYPAIPLNVQSIDFTALSNLTVLPDASALGSAAYAFGSSGLSPQFGTPVIDHAAFTVVYSNATGPIITNSQPLDTQVDYQFSDQNGYPIIGPGEQVQIDYGAAGNVTRLLYSTCQLTPETTVQIMSPAQASNSVASLFPAGANINLQLVYWCPPFLPSIPASFWQPTNVIPWYYCTATLDASNAVSNAVAPVTLMSQLIPATTDARFVPSPYLELTLSGTNVSANAVVTGGIPPYSYLWSGSDPAVSTNTSATTISYTPMIRVAVPSLSLLVISNTSVEVFWPAPSEGFVLESTTNLVSAWIQDTNVSQADGLNSVTFTNIAAVNAQFFRLVLTNQSLTVNETLALTVTDANGVSVQTNYSFMTQAVPIEQPGTQDTGTNYGCESPFESPYAMSPGAVDRAEWQAGMNAGGMSQNFCWTGASSWPGDFIEPPTRGSLLPSAWINGDADYTNCGVNSAAIVLYVGQGSPNEITFNMDNDGSCPSEMGGQMWEPYYQEETNRPFPFAVTMPDGCSLPDVNYSVPNYIGSWQNSVSNQTDNLSWLCLFSPAALDEYDAGTNGSWTRWGPAFNGLHVLTGFVSGTSGGTGFPKQFANYMLGAGLPGATNTPLTVVQSWLTAADKQGAGTGAALGPIGSNGVTDLGDHYWSKGSVGPSIPQSQIQGWWYISGHPGTPSVP